MLILAEFRCPQVTVLTALGCLQSMSMPMGKCVERVKWLVRFFVTKCLQINHECVKKMNVFLFC